MNKAWAGLMSMPTDEELVRRLRVCSEWNGTCLGCDLFNPEDEDKMEACNLLLEHAALRIESLLLELETVKNEFYGEGVQTVRGDAAPVRHERWIEVNRCHYRKERYIVPTIEERCSGCGRHVYRYETQAANAFCPTCGAIMEAEKKQ